MCAQALMCFKDHLNQNLGLLKREVWIPFSPQNRNLPWDSEVLCVLKPLHPKTLTYTKDLAT